MSDDSEDGFILEVDLDYQPELHDLRNEYPLAPEKNGSHRKHVVTLCKEASRRAGTERYLNRKTDTQSTPNGKICGTLQKPKTVFISRDETD